MSADAPHVPAPAVRVGEAAAHVWIAPAFDRSPTGGTRYDASLVAALEKRGLVCERVEPDAADVAIARRGTGVIWVDSLFLREVSRLAHRSGRRCRVVLVAHYLPSFVVHGGPLAHEQLSSVEREALASVDAVLVTSTTMAAWMRTLAPGLPIACVEPGVPAVRAEPSVSDPPRVLVLANVTEGKGILPLLRELAARLVTRDRLQLEILGSVEREPGYAEACVELAHRDPALVERVRFSGERPHSEAMRALARADLLVSASSMESYGMAVAEARAAGVPILARDAGHVAAHVAAEAGGELVGDVSELAARVLALVREPAELARRKELARARTVARSWDDAAHDFFRALGVLRLA